MDIETSIGTRVKIILGHACKGGGGVLGLYGLMSIK